MNIFLFLYKHFQVQWLHKKHDVWNSLWPVTWNILQKFTGINHLFLANSIGGGVESRNLKKFEEEIQIKGEFRAIVNVHFPWISIQDWIQIDVYVSV